MPPHPMIRFVDANEGSFLSRRRHLAQRQQLIQQDPKLNYCEPQGYRNVPKLQSHRPPQVLMGRQQLARGHISALLPPFESAIKSRQYRPNLAPQSSLEMHLDQPRQKNAEHHYERLCQPHGLWQRRQQSASIHLSAHWL